MARRQSVTSAMMRYQRERERAYAAQQRAIAEVQREARGTRSGPGAA